MNQREIASRFFELYEQGDEDALLELVSPDVTFAPVGPKKSLYLGPEGLRELLADGVPREHTIFDFQENGEHVVVLGWRRESGARWADIPEAWVLAFRDGQLASVTAYSERRKALESVGLA